MPSFRLPLIALFLILLISSCKESAKEKTTPQKTSSSKQNTPYQISRNQQDASCVYLTEDEKSNPVISWVEIDSVSKKKAFYFAKMDQNKNQFGSPIAIPIPQNTSIHEEGMPKIAIKGDGSLFALYETSESLDNSKWGLGDVRYIQSYDDGKTWTSPKSVAPKDYQAKRSSSFSGMTRLSDGEIGVAWLSTAPNDAMNGRPVKFAKTKEKKELTAPIIIDNKACECCRIALDDYKDGGIVLAYRSLRKDNIRDIATVRSIDNGDSFSAPNAFTGDEWQINGCPHNGPSIAAASKNNIFVTWYTGKEKIEGIQYAELDSLGAPSNRKRVDSYGQFIQVGLSRQGVQFLTYNQDYPGEDGDIQGRIILEKEENGKSLKKVLTLPHAKANYPVITVTSEGNPVVAWSDQGKVYYLPVAAEDFESTDPANFLTYESAR